ncbi:MAG: Uma2 family endonuclease [Thermosynechococcaceae cyanobacterium]
MTATLVQSPDRSPERLVLSGVSWPNYQSLVHDLEHQPSLRLTYDCGQLEIRRYSDPHESYKKLLGRLVEALTEELDLEIRSLGSRTCDRKDLRRGLEPDQCYYIKNESAVWNKEQIDLQQDPPPDLAIEVDITSSSLDRLAIYADLGVPEVWRYDGLSLIIYDLQNQQYQPCASSKTFMGLSPADVERFLAMKKTLKENALIRQFRQWVRENLTSTNC